MHAGTVLRVARGLAEIRFRSGARVVLEGPAILELLSANSARLRQGRLTARVPEPASGFEILSAQGKIIDRGTEFGVAVAENGATDVVVFEGKVDAAAPAGKDLVRIPRDGVARLADGAVTVRKDARPGDAGPFVRAIVPPPVIVPQTSTLDFRKARANTLQDLSGVGTGLTHRLPGTGQRLPARDPNLRLDPGQGCLELTTTDSDINRQSKVDQGEYLGVRLSDLGFTGKEDFAATALIPNIPALEFIGQFGLYAGTRSDNNIRGGVISRREAGSYTQFLVNNNGGRDTNAHFVGLFSTGDDLRLTLRRLGGKYSLTVENQTTGSASILTIRHPDFLDDAADLYVGLFAANTRSEVRRTPKGKTKAAEQSTAALQKDSFR
jgi:hypothetical protein